MKQWHYGKDGRIAGPVGEEEIKRMLAAGELGPEDLVWHEGMGDWEPSRKHFGTEAAASQDVQVPGAEGDTKPGTGKLDIGSCIQRAWDTMWREPVMVIGGVFLGLVVSMLPMIPNLLSRVLYEMGTNVDSGQQPVYLVLGIAMSLLQIVLSVVITPLITCGIFVLLLRIARGGQGKLEDLFSFFRVKPGGWAVLTYLLMMVFVLAGLLLLILPGIYLAMAYSFVFVVMADRKLKLLEALEFSRRTITPQWWIYFLFVILLFLLNLVGVVLCCVGLIVTYPLMMLATTYAYLDMTQTSGEVAQMDAPAPPSV